ncbi:hypothetical protein QBC47DRAFT_391625 [Echria macrotheca]|uniref:Stress-response A/B barrel domain-containing protein n=1 Tax=Echria macrotheca TaxID=438768 RepID=A0AAJ0B455_9PEZI|nr:hypothetical protein QBC47DRAFT_391625 [Echria macrotheca]
MLAYYVLNDLGSLFSLSFRHVPSHCTMKGLELDDECKPRHSPAKLIALSILICGLVRLVLFDPLGIASFAAPCSHHNVKHVILFQFKPEVSPGTVDEALSRMLALKENCHHPYTGVPYITNINADTPPAFLDHHTHGFVVQFQSVDERDYFLLHDPAFADLQRDLKPLTEDTTEALYALENLDP